jgi:hypothetical protein
MKKFSLIEYSVDHVRMILDDSTAPVMESTLLSRLSKKFGYPNFSKEFMYEIHFSLYHALYKLKVTLTQHYLHTDPMRIKLKEIPPAGFCRFYHPEDGSFCRNKTGSIYCKKHTDESIVYPVVDYLLPFYLDSENIFFNQDYNLEIGMDRVIYYGINKQKVDDALAYFNISCLDKVLAYRNYRKLALKFHPDRTGSDSKMKEINSQFQILKALF